MDESGEILSGTEEGANKVRATRRKGTMTERWDKDVFDGLKGVPWEPIPGREGIKVKSYVHLPQERSERPEARQGKTRKGK